MTGAATTRQPHNELPDAHARSSKYVLFFPPSLSPAEVMDSDFVLLLMKEIAENEGEDVNYGHASLFLGHYNGFDRLYPFIREGRPSGRVCQCLDVSCLNTFVRLVL